MLRDKKQLEQIVVTYDAQLRALSDAEVLLELAEEASDEDSAKEAAGQVTQVVKALDDIEFRRMLSGELDAGGAIVQITAGAGGVDAQRLGADADAHADPLLRAQGLEGRGARRAARPKRPASRARRSPSTGDYAYGLLKAENGVHRLVRVSPFDANARRQTSFAAVTVTPDIDDDIEVEINDVDLRIDTYRAGGAGGQHVNKTDSAVRITHLPTGIVVQCQNERSQHSNKAKAMKMLRAKLYERQEQEEGRRGCQGAPQDRVGLADPQLRAVPVPAGQRSPHRAQGRQRRRGARRRPRRVHPGVPD